MPTVSFDAWSDIFLGAYLAFYSFVGFEDMVNVAEEVKRPQRNLPIAILASLGLTAVLYCCVTLSVVLAVDQRDWPPATRRCRSCCLVPDHPLLRVAPPQN